MPFDFEVEVMMGSACSANVGLSDTVLRYVYTENTAKYGISPVSGIQKYGFCQPYSQRGGKSTLYTACLTLDVALPVKVVQNRILDYQIRIFVRISAVCPYIRI